MVAVSKFEVKNAIRLLFYKWHANYAAKGAFPDLRAFIEWLDTSGYGHYLQFQCETSAAQEVRAWFTEEFARA
jgi:hypothetical protein